MKKILLILSMALLTVSAQAQQYLRVWQGEDSQRIALSETAQMPFSASGVNIGGTQYALSAIDSITFVKTVTVQWNGPSATVTIPDVAKKDVTATVDGGHVVITNSNVTEEMEFVLSGESTDGSLTYNGQYKCKFHLNGVQLTSTRGGALDIQCGKRIDLILTDGTTNSLTDSKTGTQKAALYCKGHLEVQGGGKLAVSGQCKHAISTKEYLLLKKNAGTIDILAAASDALHIGQYFQMNGGTINISDKTMADGIQVDATGDAADELNGQIIIKGGTIKATIAHEDCKGIKNGGSEDGLVPCGAITIQGGTIDIQATGNGSRGIQTEANMLIAQTDKTLPTTITINAAGGLCTLKECAEDPHRCMGIKVDSKLTVTGGTTTVTNTGKKSRGIKATVYDKQGGTVNATVTQG